MCIAAVLGAPSRRRVGIARPTWEVFTVTVATIHPCNLRGRGSLPAQVRLGAALRAATQAPASKAGRRDGASTRRGSSGGLLPGPADVPRSPGPLAAAVDLPHDVVVLEARLRGAVVDPGPRR